MIIESVLGWLLKIGFSGLIDRTLSFLEARAARETDAARIRAQITVETIRAAVEDTRIRADLEKAKFQVPWFWLFAGLFVFPLGFWWTAVIVDSVFRIPGWDVAALPPPLDDWAARMIAWLFFAGSVRAGVSAIAGRR